MVVVCALAVASGLATRVPPVGAQSITEYTAPTAGGGPHGITVGPDGNLWFAENPGRKIGNVTTSGTFIEYSPPTGPITIDIVAGPDGNLWFTEETANKIGRLNPGSRAHANRDTEQHANRDADSDSNADAHYHRDGYTDADRCADRNL